MSGFAINDINRVGHFSSIANLHFFDDNEDDDDENELAEADQPQVNSIRMYS